MPISSTALLIAIAAHRRQQAAIEEAPHRVCSAISYDSTLLWTVDSWPKSDWRQWVRFERSEVITLVQVLNINSITFRFRNQPSPELALCIVLRRFAYPGRWIDCCSLFGHAKSYLSAVFTDVLEYLSRRFLSILQWHPRLRVYSNLRKFARASRRAGCGGRIWGFIDGHFMGFCRPVRGQKSVYSGKEKAHGQKYQAIVTPDGLISSLEGPFTGADHDWKIYTEGRVEERLRRLFEQRPGRASLWLYGDPAYHCVYGVIAPYKHHLGRRHLPPEQRQFNKVLSRYRISVEHAFGQTQRLWTYASFAKALRSGSQATGQFYYTIVLLTNCLICLRGGNQTSFRYGVKPPNIYEYLGIAVPGGETA